MLEKQIAETPRTRRRLRNREQILDAARDLVRERGVEGLSLRSVAARADYSPAALYEYFAGKEQLLAELARSSQDRLRVALTRVRSKSVEERLVLIGLAYVRFARRNQEDFQLLSSHLPSRRTSKKQPVSEESAYHPVYAAVREAIAQGRIRADASAVEEIAYSFWALVHGMAMLQLTHLRSRSSFVAVDRRALEALVAGWQRS